MQGVIRMADTLLLGPTSLGEFIPVTIRGIHRKRLPVREVRGGQTASFALKKVHVHIWKLYEVIYYPMHLHVGILDPWNSYM